MKQQRPSNMTETNRIEFKRELTDDLDFEKEIKVLICTGCFPIDCKQNTQQLGRKKKYNKPKIASYSTRTTIAMYVSTFTTTMRPSG